MEDIFENFNKNYSANELSRKLKIKKKLKNSRRDFLFFVIVLVKWLKLIIFKEKKNYCCIFERYFIYEIS